MKLQRCNCIKSSGVNYTVCIQLYKEKKWNNNGEYQSRNPVHGIYMHCQLGFLPPVWCQGPPREERVQSNKPTGVQFPILCSYTLVLNSPYSQKDIKPGVNWSKSPPLLTFHVSSFIYLKECCHGIILLLKKCPSSLIRKVLALHELPSKMRQK